MENIKIAFCTDDNLINPACVTIASLLDFKKDENIHYDIYLIYSGANFKTKKKVEKIIKNRDINSNLYFKQVENTFKDGFEIRTITKGCYLRLELHNYFPDVNKIIYSDVDILFRDNLLEVWNFDIKDNYFLGVKATANINESWQDNSKKFDYWHNFIQGEYINSGFLVMNLKKIREVNLDGTWHKMSLKNYFFVDQDIINLTSLSKIGFLPLRYNVVAYASDDTIAKFKDFYNKNIVNDAINNPAVIHFAGPKPWTSEEINKADIWLNYVSKNKDLKKLFKNSLFKKIFSIENIKNRKVITIFGVKIKFKR